MLRTVTLLTILWSVRSLSCPSLDHRRLRSEWSEDWNAGQGNPESPNDSSPEQVKVDTTQRDGDYGMALKVILPWGVDDDKTWDAVIEKSLETQSSSRVTKWIESMKDGEHNDGAYVRFRQIIKDATERGMAASLFIVGPTGDGVGTFSSTDSNAVDIVYNKYAPKSKGGLQEEEHEENRNGQQVKVGGDARELIDLGATMDAIAGEKLEEARQKRLNREAEEQDAAEPADDDVDNEDTRSNDEFFMDSDDDTAQRSAHQ